MRVIRVWRAWSSALLALAVLLSTLAGGTSYLYCTMTESVVAGPCCEPDEDDGLAQDAVDDPSSCCVKMTTGTLPQGVGSPVFVFAASPALAAPAAVALVVAPAGVLARVTREPTGPPLQYGRARPQVMLL